jgi:hypothetical protein
MRPQQIYIILNRNGSVNCTTSDWEVANQIIASEELNGNYDMTVHQCNHYTNYQPVDCTEHFTSNTLG